MFGASFQIGRSALAAYQAALSITGQNIANVANPDYTRQTGRLEAQRGGALSGATPGAGVRLAQLRRHVDEALENRLRLARGDRSLAETVQRTLGATEANYNELSEQDLSSQLGELFAAFGQLQTHPGELTERNNVIATADAVVRTLHRQRSGLVTQVVDLNTDAGAAAERINELATVVADLNQHIAFEESDKTTVAGALRDQRDAALREMSELCDIQVRERENGSITVYLGSEPLVDFDRSRGLKAETVRENGLETARLRYIDSNGTAVVRGGKLGGIVEARSTLVDQLDRFDQLARGLIYEVNRVHSSGVGTVGYSRLTSNYAVLDPNAALDSTAAGLPFPVQNGALLVKLRDVNSGQVITRQIKIDLGPGASPPATLNSLVAELNAVPGLTASLTSDNKLQLAADPGQEFWFNDDTAGVMAALGVGAFFTGTNAATIDVDPTVRADARHVVSAVEGQLNDGRIAGRMALLASSGRGSALLDGQSIQDFQTDMVGRLAVTTAAAQSAFDASDTVLGGLVAQRESISGVSLDEEAINLTQFEKAYQGAARYLDVVNNVNAELLAILR